MKEHTSMSDIQTLSRGDGTIEELEGLVAYAAHLVLRYGDVVSPILDRMESELEVRKRTRSPQDRARAALERYTSLKLDSAQGDAS